MGRPTEKKLGGFHRGPFALRGKCRLYTGQQLVKRRGGVRKEEHLAYDTSRQVASRHRITMHRQTVLCKKETVGPVFYM
ncbi:hypothetical protein cyc_06412 [Cyclospora cayetanensis]|uniref:Uncharacterized protein n=1 Tax=Cyclospora cayetanensis TaxID=88456 RepID=A0A1D3CTB1_9EIME|nr:hypothetical protein cyc_06412 [Cyclospora cayetanensis]